jgi:hypothetical protein
MKNDPTQASFELEWGTWTHVSLGVRFERGGFYFQLEAIQNLVVVRMGPCRGVASALLVLVAKNHCPFVAYLAPVRTRVAHAQQVAAGGITSFPDLIL